MPVTLDVARKWLTDPRLSAVDRAKRVEPVLANPFDEIDGEDTLIDVFAGLRVKVDEAFLAALSDAALKNVVTYAGGALAEAARHTMANRPSLAADATATAVRIGDRAMLDSAALPSVARRLLAKEAPTADWIIQASRAWEWLDAAGHGEVKGAAAGPLAQALVRGEAAWLGEVLAGQLRAGLAGPGSGRGEGPILDELIRFEGTPPAFARNVLRAALGGFTTGPDSEDATRLMSRYAADAAVQEQR